MESVLPIQISPVGNSTQGFFVSQNKNSSLFLNIWDHFVPHARNNYHPHLFSHRLTGLFSLMLVVLKVFTLTVISIGPVVPAFSSAITAENIINLTNLSRESYKIPALRENVLLAHAAQAKADDMLAKGYFSHNTPDGKTPWDFIVATGYNYISAGENLAVNFTEAESVEDAWMNSPGHKANIINKNFSEIGIGISSGQYQGHQAIFVVQMFGNLAEQKITIDEKSTPVQRDQVPPPAIVPQQVKGSLKSVSQTTDNQQENLQIAVVSPIQNTTEEKKLSTETPTLKVDGNVVELTTRTSDSAIKVVATMGQQAVMLDPKDNNVWSGSFPLADAASGDKTVIIKAFNIKGESLSLQAAEFSGSTPANYNLIFQAKDGSRQLGNFKFDPKIFEQRFYLMFIAGMLASLALAIGIKRHMQHISLVANGSFVVILASLLFMSG